MKLQGSSRIPSSRQTLKTSSWNTQAVWLSGWPTMLTTNHNMCALDCKITFHGMWITKVSAPFEKPQHTSQNSQIQRNKIMKVGIATADKGIPIKWFKKLSELGLSAERFKPLIELQSPYVLPLSTSCGLLWHSAQKVYTGNQPWSSWAGFIQHTCLLLI